MGDVTINIQDIHNIILDISEEGGYYVEFTRVGELDFEQVVVGEGLCEFCGDPLDECQCGKFRATIAENILLNYVNDVFNSSENDSIVAIVNGKKYKKVS